MSIRMPLSEAERAERLKIGEFTKTAAGHVRWENIKQGGGFRSFAAIQRALFSSVADMDNPFLDVTSLSALVDYCDRKAIFFPTEGFVPPSLERSIGRLLERLGHQEIILSDEFGIKNVGVAVARLLESESVVLEFQCSYPSTISAARFTSADGRFQCDAAEGAFYTTIRVTDQEVDDLLSNTFDGFWCTSDRAESWWLPPMHVVQSPNG